ncbi:DNA polymerase, partial [Candidatus Liberibacter sp.]|uniref:DNA polymerase n=1 Tax=Candidatus Liberibacter sp. TaxID=34022 RepID=UPI0015F3F3B0
LFGEYCVRDVEATRAIFKLLKPLSPNEHHLWLLDQDINDRGYAIDVPLVHTLAHLVDEARNELDHSLKDLTAGAVCTSRQNQRLLLWIFLETWLELPDLKEDTVVKVLGTVNLPDNVRTVLQNRLKASRSSVLKLKTLASAVSNDNRLRGTLQFMGASRTGRWAGRVFQPQNLPRPSTPHEEIEESLDSGSYPQDNLLRFASDSIRSCIVAPKGKKLVVADLSGIEARVLAWCAGEQWKVDAFKSGEDIYVTTYARTFNLPPRAVTNDQRDIGKVMELALGYQGGAGVFLKMASNRGLNLNDFANAVREIAPLDTWEEAESFCLWMQSEHPEFAIEDLTIGTACELVKKAWRNKHPFVQSLWKDCDDAFEYTLNIGNRISVRRKAPDAPTLQMRKVAGNIYLTLPTGRDLVYRDVGVGKTYLSVDVRGIGSRRDTTYGGKLTENIVQAISRDILCEGMKNATEAGYPIVLTVHDEIVCEVPDSDEFSSDTLCALMTKNPSWATGLPLNAKGFEAKRYRK